MKFLHDLTIKKFHQGLLAKEFSALEITQEFFSYIADKDPEVDAYLSLNEEKALREAEETDLSLARGEEIPFIAGAPLAIKDNILVKDLPCTASSKILENYTAAYDATVIKKLKENKAVFLGKTNLDEFAMGSSTENSAFKKTKNPYDLERVPGGSSGGSAAAVSASLAVAALGTDTGGSIRQPAGFCGIVGLKPTYGAVSRFGAIAMASSLDQIGPLSKTAEDAAIVFDVIKGKDLLDSTSVEANYSKNELLNPHLEKIKKLKVGLPKEYFIDGMDKTTQKEIESAVKKIKSLGLEVKEISLPHTKYALSVYYIIMTAEVSANLARYDGVRYGRISNLKKGIANLKDLYFKQRGEGFGAEARRRIILGTYVLSAGYYDAYYAKAQKVRRLIKEDFDKAFSPSDGGVDVILTPVSPTPAFKLGEKLSDPLQMYLSDIFTIPVNLAALPALSLPVRRYGKIHSPDFSLPVGFQLIGKPFREADILGLGQFYERLG